MKKVPIIYRHFCSYYNLNTTLLWSSISDRSFLKRVTRPSCTYQKGFSLPILPRRQRNPTGLQEWRRVEEETWSLQRVNFLKRDMNLEVLDRILFLILERTQCVSGFRILFLWLLGTTPVNWKLILRKTPLTANGIVDELPILFLRPGSTGHCTFDIGFISFTLLLFVFFLLVTTRLPLWSKHVV